MNYSYEDILKFFNFMQTQTDCKTWVQLANLPKKTILSALGERKHLHTAKTFFIKEGYSLLDR